MLKIFERKKIVLAAILLSALFCAQAAFGQAPKTAIEFIQRGIDYLNDGEYTKALADFNQGLKLEPNGEYTAANYLYRGITYSTMKDYDKAIADFNQADKLEPNDSGVLAWRGDAYFLKSEIPGPNVNVEDLRRRALADLNKSIQVEPDYAWAYARRAYFYGQTGDRDKALADYNKSIQLDPDDAEVYKNRAYLYTWSFRDTSKALEDYNQAIRLNPNDASYYAARAETYRNMANEALGGNGDYTRAIADYTQAIKLDPKEPKNYSERGFAYYKMNNYRNAIPDLEQAIKLWTGYKGDYYSNIEWYLADAKKKR